MTWINKLRQADSDLQKATVAEQMREQYNYHFVKHSKLAQKNSTIFRRLKLKSLENQMDKLKKLIDLVDAHLQEKKQTEKLIREGKIDEFMKIFFDSIK